MSANADGEAPHEIIIVRRGGLYEDEGHHGGVWKIAFADFMTALMCFFLVMWLINAANEQTRAALASYFNPVKLVDRNTNRKGLDDPDKNQEAPVTEPDKDGPNADAEAGSKDKKAGPAEKKNSEDDNKKRHSDQNLFAHPYAVLSEIAGETGVMQNTSTKGDGGAQAAGPATGASGGEAYRDPFAPNFWSEEVDTGDKANETALPTRAAADETGGKAGTGKAAEASAAAAKPESGQPAPTAEGTARQEIPPGAAPRAEAAKAGAEKAGAGTAAAPEPRPAEEAAEIRRQLAKDFSKDDKIYEGLTVVPTDKGVMISVTDQLNFGMFEIGSAVPRRELVLAMEKIARTLQAHKGTIRISGHTDARPFKSDTYDNWRLSSARAQSAYYMLARAGLDEKRIIAVTGYADRRLKVKNDPYAAANRRIEILLENDQ